MVLSQGDWGTQFGMLIQYLAESRPGGLADPTISELAIHDLQVIFCSSVTTAIFCTSVCSFYSSTEAASCVCAKQHYSCDWTA